MLFTRTLLREWVTTLFFFPESKRSKWILILLRPIPVNHTEYRSRTWSTLSTYPIVLVSCLDRRRFLSFYRVKSAESFVVPFSRSQSSSKYRRVRHWKRSTATSFDPKHFSSSRRESNSNSLYPFDINFDSALIYNLSYFHIWSFPKESFFFSITWYWSSILKETNVLWFSMKYFQIVIIFFPRSFMRSSKTISLKLYSSNISSKSSRH